jgi:hypothetical protein
VAGDSSSRRFPGVRVSDRDSRGSRGWLCRDPERSHRWRDSVRLEN